ncbi:MAG: hypothetical protein IKE70_04835 [Bacilli bacterium]|nr:hypothetical protein [Bacilli bacterium]
MSIFKDIFDYSDEDIYKICKELGFNQEKIEKYCGTYRISFSQFQHRGLVSLLEKIPSFLDMSDSQMDFFYNDKFRKVVRKYEKFLRENPISLENSDVFNAKAIWVDIQNTMVEFFERVNYDKEEIKKKCYECGLSYQETVNHVARFFINSNRRLARDNMDLIKDKFGPLTDKRIELVSDLYERVLACQNKEEIIDICNSSVQIFSSNYFYDYVVLYHSDTLDETLQSLKDKMAIYNEYKKELRSKIHKNIEEVKRDDRIQNARPILLSFLQSDCKNLEEFCLNLNITVSKFKTILKLFSDDDSLKKKVLEKIEILNQNELNFYLNIGNHVLDKVKNGMGYRCFDLVDYYQITDIPLDKLFQKIKKALCVDDVKLFGKFLSQYQNAKIMNDRGIQTLLDSRQVVGVKVDSDGKSIPNSGREITLDEKLFLLDYLKKNNIPFYDDVYRVALSRYLDHTLEEEKENIRSL